MSGFLCTCLLYYSSLSVCHAVLSILSRVYKLLNVSESPLEVCISSRRVVTLVYGSGLEFWWSSSPITPKPGE